MDLVIPNKSLSVNGRWLGLRHHPLITDKRDIIEYKQGQFIQTDECYYVLLDQIHYELKSSSPDYSFNIGTGMPFELIIKNITDQNALKLKMEWI